jgi:hypothetical protein
VLATWVVCASAFALRQELWVDETTQLSGLTLGPVELVRWLGGADPSRFGVPGDRSAPLAYWLGWLWSQAFGLSEDALRAFGLVCVALGLALLVRSAQRAAGPLAGWVASAWRCRRT